MGLFTDNEGKNIIDKINNLEIELDRTQLLLVPVAGLFILVTLVNISLTVSANIRIQELEELKFNSSYCAKSFGNDSYIIYNSLECEDIRVQEGLLPFNKPLIIDVAGGNFYMQEPNRIVYLKPKRYFPNIRTDKVIDINNAVHVYPQKYNGHCNADSYMSSMNTCILA